MFLKLTMYSHHLCVCIKTSFVVSTQIMTGSRVLIGTTCEPLMFPPSGRDSSMSRNPFFVWSLSWFSKEVSMAWYSASVSFPFPVKSNCLIKWSICPVVTTAPNRCLHMTTSSPGSMRPSWSASNFAKYLCFMSSACLPNRTAWCSQCVWQHLHAHKPFSAQQQVFFLRQQHGQ